MENVNQEIVNSDDNYERGSVRVEFDLKVSKKVVVIDSTAYNLELALTMLCGLILGLGLGYTFASL